MQFLFQNLLKLISSGLIESVKKLNYPDSIADSYLVFYMYRNTYFKY
jgi:hypothetical protein